MTTFYFEEKTNSIKFRLGLFGCNHQKTGIAEYIINEKHIKWVLFFCLVFVINFKKNSQVL